MAPKPEYKVGPMPAQIAPAILAKLVQVETATVGHTRHWGFMDRRIQPLLPEKRIAGTAITLAIPAQDCCTTPWGCSAPATSWWSTGSATTSMPAGAAASPWQRRPPAPSPASWTARAPTSRRFARATSRSGAAACRPSPPGSTISGASSTSR